MGPCLPSLRKQHTCKTSRNSEPIRPKNRGAAWKSVWVVSRWWAVSRWNTSTVLVLGLHRANYQKPQYSIKAFIYLFICVAYIMTSRNDKINIRTWQFKCIKLIKSGFKSMRKRNWQHFFGVVYELFNPVPAQLAMSLELSCMSTLAPRLSLKRRNVSGLELKEQAKSVISSTLGRLRPEPARRFESISSYSVYRSTKSWKNLKTAKTSDLWGCLFKVNCWAFSFAVSAVNQLQKYQKLYVVYLKLD